MSTWMHRKGFWIKRVRVPWCRSEWLSVPPRASLWSCSRQQGRGAALRIHAHAHAGVGGLALNPLAEEAGVPNGTVDNDFRSREQVLKAADSGAERLGIAVRTFMDKACTDPDWTRALITVVRYAEGMRSARATYLRADRQAGSRQGDFHYAHEEMAMSMVISATLGAMNLPVEDGEVEHADRIAAEMVLQALGVLPEKAARVAGLPWPGEGG